MNISKSQFMLIIAFNAFFLLKTNVLSACRKRRTELLIQVHRLPSTVQDCRLSGVISVAVFEVGKSMNRFLKAKSPIQKYYILDIFIKSADFLNFYFAHFTTNFGLNLQKYRNDPKFSDRQAWANSDDPDQTASSGSTLFAIPSASSGCITLR